MKILLKLDICYAEWGCAIFGELKLLLILVLCAVAILEKIVTMAMVHKRNQIIVDGVFYELGMHGSEITVFHGKCSLVGRVASGKS